MWVRGGPSSLSHTVKTIGGGDGSSSGRKDCFEWQAKEEMIKTTPEFNLQIKRNGYNVEPIRGRDRQGE